MKTHHIVVTYGIRLSRGASIQWGLEKRMAWVSWDHYPSVEGVDELDAANRAISLSQLDHPEAHGFSASLPHDTTREITRLILPEHKP